MNRFILAVQFLTVFPVRKDIAAERHDLSASMAYFPLVGALQGLVLAGSDYALSWFLPESVINGILLMILALTNGGLHLDGFADTVDGLAGGATPEDRLRIMRDSSTGAVGAVFLILVLLIKYMALCEIPLEAKSQALFVFPVAGRWAMVPLACWAGYARKEDGLGAAFASNTGATLFKATVFGALLSALVMGLFSLALFALLGGLAYMTARYFKKKIGGVTGDVFGFQSETAEVLFLIAALALSNILTA